MQPYLVLKHQVDEQSPGTININGVKPSQNSDVYQKCIYKVQWQGYFQTMIYEVIMKYILHNTTIKLSREALLYFMENNLDELRFSFQMP